MVHTQFHSSAYQQQQQKTQFVWQLGKFKTLLIGRYCVYDLAKQQYPQAGIFF
jgi:hypothetical protein